MHPVIWIPLVLVTTNLFTGVMAWKFGVLNGEKWENYRWRTRIDINRMAYGSKFLETDNTYAQPPKRYKVRHADGTISKVHR